MKKTGTILLVVGILLLIAGIVLGLLYDIGVMVALVIVSVLLNTVAVTLRRGKGK